MELGVESGPLFVPIIPEPGEVFVGFVGVDNRETVVDIGVVGACDAMSVGPHFEFSALLQEFVSCGYYSFHN